ncbi:disulfide bond formation protein DsbB [Marinobacter daqiaonensis]|uniref:Disulfide bond formation protein B n=1 Tax=Marinobacter daqiaonensis TaxID=650891 RepID=A0A1I6I2D9_9GAMM|nr:disulfide bond formation protein B [Marinobacter daqiaonensis]SFR60906.1 disulfide bond formation protein DsbB [Marinobacter daqiaonensis]
MRRLVFLFALLVPVVLLAVAFYMEYVMELEPCPLCWLQRYAFMAVAAVALLALIHNPGDTGGRIYGFFLALFAGAGLGIAGRQLWLQSLPPDQVPACGSSVDYMLEVFPLIDVLAWALKGTGDCARVVWTFLGLSIPGWTAVFFTIILLSGLGVLFGLFRRASSGR